MMGRRPIRLVPYVGVLIFLSLFQAMGELRMSSQAILQLEAKIEKSVYSAEDPIDIQLTVSNTSAESFTLFDYGRLNGMYLFDAVLYKKSGTERQKMELQRPWIAEKA